MKTIAKYFKRLSVIIITTSLLQSVTTVGFAQDNYLAMNTFVENFEAQNSNVDPIKVLSGNNTTSTSNLTLKSAAAKKEVTKADDKKSVSLSNCLKGKKRLLKCEPKRAMVYNPIESGF